MSDRTVVVLKELFGSVTTDDTIQRIATFYNGSLSPSVEALMKLTNSELQIGGNVVSINSSQTLSPQTKSQKTDNNQNLVSQPAMSYKSVFDRNKQKEFKSSESKGQPKPQTDILNIYSNKKAIENVVNEINKGHRVLVLLRGLPGSGKSTLAKNIAKLTVNCYTSHIFSSDDFFLVNGAYRYNREKIGDAHVWNQRRVSEAASNGVSPIIIDNTNLEIWEMQIYASYGVNNGYIIEVLEPNTPWCRKVGELSRRSVHGVPSEKVKRMNEKFQRNVSGANLLDWFRLEYYPNMVPPKERLIPKITKKIENVVTANHFEAKNEDPYTGASTSSDFFGLSKFNTNHAPTSANNVNSSESDDFASKTNNESKYISCMLEQVAKPQRSDSGSRRNGLLRSFSDTTDWKTIDDWECIELETNNTLESKAPLVDIDYCSYEHVVTQTEIMTPEDLNNYKQLTPVNRLINSHSPPRNNYCRSLSQKVKLDKGVMTDIEMLSSEWPITRTNKIMELKSLFEHIPTVYLIEILDRCNEDVNWACEILLDSSIDSNNIIITNTPDEVDDTLNVVQNNDTAENPTAEWENVAYSETSTNPSVEEEETVVEMKEICMEDGESKKIDTSELKRQIEQNFVIPDDRYSDHVLKIRKMRQGITETEAGDVSSTEYSSAATGDDSNDSNYDIMETKLNDINIDEGSNSEDAEPEEEVETVSVRVGHDFIGELNRIYKTSFYDCSLEPVIHMPVALLDQIHALWLESMCNQIDVQKELTKAVIQEDEELARQLDAQEKEEMTQGHQSEVPNLKEIMEMEIDLARYNMAHSEWKRESPDDLATKLSKQKLIKLFPDLSENILMEVLHAYDYNFGAAFEDLLLSTGRVSKSQTDEIDPMDLQRILAEQEKDLIERTLQEKNKEISVSVDIGPSSSHSIQDAKELVEAYRREARELLSLRNRHHAKAQEYSARKMLGSAAYYSNLANLYTKKHNYVNSLAASEIVDINTKDNNTLDLHTFYVKESLEVLDMYLDKNIRMLRERNKKPYHAKLFLITGRGIHSPGQQAKIKPAVRRRLRQRNLRYSEVNPGLLSVVVSTQDVLTDFM